jgi:aryl-alcohol dehydrogenase-like predicted oxidoreductase
LPNEAAELGLFSDLYTRGKSEEMMGNVLREFPRHALVISSKVFFPMSDEVNDRGAADVELNQSALAAIDELCPADS